MSYILEIASAVPEYQYSQEELMHFYRNSTDDESSKRKIKILAAKSGINTRHSVLADYGRTSGNFTFFEQNPTLLPKPSLSKRMAIYQREAIALSLKCVQKLALFEQNRKHITHIITVTCTGLFAPGLDIELLQGLNLSPNTKRSSVNFLGCNAAIIALKQANDICNSQPDALVLIVCTELCTLHFQTDYSDDYLLSNLLFADGSAAVLVGSQQPENTSLKIHQFDSLCIPASKNEMAWQLSETGFVMNLSSYVADLIKDNMQSLFDQIGVDAKAVDHWAVHPGGKKIVDNFALALGLPITKLAASYQTLRDYGNMSSPTVLFVLQLLFNQHATEKLGQSIFAAAFGPGLSVETMQLQYA